MAINFPDSPSTNDTHTVNGRTWIWNGQKWKKHRAAPPSVLPTATVSNDFAAGDTLHVDSTNSSVGIGTSTPNASDALTVGGDTTIVGNVAVSGYITVPTQTAGTNDTKVATTEFVSTAVANLINSAPDALNTLDELAAALGDDANYAATITTSLAGKSDTSHTHSYLSTSGGTVDGDLSVTGRFQIGGHYIDDVAGTGNPYGSINVGGAMSWDGYAIDERVVFMHDGALNWGIYNDVDNEWMIYGTLNAGVELKYNNSTKLSSTSDGADVVGTMWADAFKEKATGANLDQSGANYGSWNINNYTRGGYYGIALNNGANFMYSSSAMGIYNDVENEWIMYGDRNSESFMFYNGGVRVTCRSDGVSNAGRIITDGISYNHGVCGGAANSIAFRWASPYGKMSIDNVICAIAADFSDERVKADITSWDGGIDMIRDLRPVTYRPRDIIGFGEVSGNVIEGPEVRDETYIGLIAQEVRNVIPSAVLGDPDGPELLSIAKDQLLGVIVSALQNIDNRLKELENV